MKPTYDHNVYRSLQASSAKHTKEGVTADMLEMQTETLYEMLAHIEHMWSALRMQSLHINDMAQTNFRLAIFRGYYAMFFNHLPTSIYLDLESDLMQFIVTDRALIDQCEIVETDGQFWIYGNIDMEGRMNTYRELVTKVNDKETADMVVLLLKFVDNEFKRLSA